MAFRIIPTSRAFNFLDHLKLLLLDYPIPTLALSTLGAASFLAFAYRLSTFLHAHLLHRSALPRYLHRHPPSSSASADAKPPAQETQAWALITGASDGIGRGFAHELASQGFNLLLHARNPAKLDAVIAAIHAQHPTTAIRPFILSASDLSDASTTALADAIAALPGPLTLLVNNIGGVPSPHYRSLPRHDYAFSELVLAANARFSLHASRVALPALAAHAPAAILTIGSLARTGIPLLTTYSATKAFVLAFAHALARECRWLPAPNRPPVEVKAYLVGTTSDTSAFRGAGETWMRPSARTLARGALHKLGLAYDVVYATVGHAVMGEVSALLPDRWLDGLFEGQVAGTEDWAARML